SLLLANKADPNILNNSNYTPIETAVEGARADVTLTLIKNGAQVNRIDKTGNDLVHRAVRTGGPLLGHLITAGAPIDRENHNNVTPFYLALQSGNVDSVKQLQKAGADVFKKYSRGPSYLH